MSILFRPFHLCVTTEVASSGAPWAPALILEAEVGQQVALPAGDGEALDRNPLPRSISPYPHNQASNPMQYLRREHHGRSQCAWRQGSLVVSLPKNFFPHCRSLSHHSQQQLPCPPTIRTEYCQNRAQLALCPTWYLNILAAQWMSNELRGIWSTTIVLWVFPSSYSWVVYMCVRIWTRGLEIK